MTSEDITIHRGLTGVYFDRSNTTYIDGKDGVLEYRGYNINELAEQSTFEETAYLLIYGTLPTQAELDEYDAELKSAREPGEPASGNHRPGVNHGGGEVAVAYNEEIRQREAGKAAVRDSLDE